MSPSVSLLRAVTLGSSLAILALPAGAKAQTLGGQLLHLDTKKPLAGAAVALVDDSARVVASTQASPDGAFYLDAPAAGRYRLVVLVSGASFVSPSVRLSEGKTVEQLFSVPDVPATFAAALFARDVTKPASPVPGGRGPLYPAGLAEEGIRATVSTMFVVDASGQPDLATFRVLNTVANERFVDAIKDALKTTRFVPARKDEEWVPQVVQYTYDFGLPGDPDRGDVMVRPPLQAVARQRGASSPDARSTVKQMYVVREDELSRPDIEQMNLVEALQRLRPRVYGGTRNVLFTSPNDGPVFVNDVRVQDITHLRNITAGNVEEVRFWKREEAAIKFGMEYRYAVTVKMKPDRS